MNHVDDENKTSGGVGCDGSDGGGRRNMHVRNRSPHREYKWQRSTSSPRTVESLNSDEQRSHIEANKNLMMILGRSNKKVYM